MRSLVVFGGALVVAGSSIAGMLQMDNPNPQVAEVLSMITGGGASEKLRTPSVLQNKSVGSSEQQVQPALIAKASNVLQSGKLSVGDAEKRKLVAALGGVTGKPGMTTEVAKPMMRKLAAAPVAVAAEQKATEKLVETIRGKAVIEAKKQQAIAEIQKAKTTNLAAKVKNNINYENNQRSQRALVSAQPNLPVIVRSKPDVMVKKPVKPAVQLALLTKKERTDLGKLVKEKKLPAIDVTIEFDYKSAQLRPNALPQLAKIGEALTDGQLADATFVIAGHTDSVGGSKYNMGLSSQRAHAVLDYLKTRFKIANERLLAVGYGEERLKNSADSKAAENRRVEFITLVR